MTVPNQFPSIAPSARRIAIVGEAPGRDEDHFGQPFVGESGRFLDSALGHVGLVRAQCFVGNVAQVMPAKCSFDAFDWTSTEVQSGIAQLQQDLAEFKPKMVLCLGNAALHLFKHGNVAPPRKGERHDWPDKITDWRGSLFESVWPSLGAAIHQDGMHKRSAPVYKCMATFHPAAVLREFGWQAYTRFDLCRLRDESWSSELVLPQRRIGVVGNDIMLEEGFAHLARFRADKKTVSVDIEGGAGNVTCIAFSRSPGTSLVFPLAHIDGRSRWDLATEIEILSAVKALLEDADVPKLAQNGLYDFFALAWTYGIVVKNFAEDSMLAWWECYPELEKSLAAQVSILTKEPFYKPDLEKADKKSGETRAKLKFASDDEFWRYNGIDAAVTFECWQKEMLLLDEGQKSHYRFNMSLMPAILYMMLRGLKLDKAKIKDEREKAQSRAMELQARIDKEAVQQGSVCDQDCDLELLAELVECPQEVPFARLALSYLGGKAPKHRVQVIQERWQPMRWTGKKWVKDGKTIERLPEVLDFVILDPVGPPVLEGQRGFACKHKTVEKLVPFTPSTLSDCEPHILKSCAEQWKIVKRLWKELKAQAVGGGLGTRHSVLLGEISTALGLAINVGSTNEGGDSQVFLYDTCQLPRVYKDGFTGRYGKEEAKDHKRRLAGEKTTVPAGKRISTDQNALDKLYAESQDVRVLWCLQQRRLRKVVTDLNTDFDDDGRLRASISLVKETGRMAESASMLGTGLNRQALNKDLRCIAVADEGCELCQCDLEGADSWTVAAECLACGDPKMLEDLRAGLKPAKGLCFGYFHPDVYAVMSAEEIKAALEKIEMPEWLYPGAKSSIHGSSYGMGWRTMIDNVLKFSMADLPLELADAKPTVLTKAQVERLQGAVFARYTGIHKWHEREAANLLSKGVLETSVGHKRKILGRKAEISRGRKVACHETLKEVLASKPQFYTTYATKRALWRLWYDEENYREDGSLIVEPLLCVHDSLMTQWQEKDGAFGRAKMKVWFVNPIVIAGTEVVIPADGTVGKDWSMKGAEKL